MITADPFRDQATLSGTLVRVEPLTESVFAAYWAAMADPELSRLTGSHGSAAAEQIRDWLSSRKDHHDRADWAIVDVRQGTFLGEVVLNDLDADNESANFRIWLTESQLGRGYGTEATRLVVAYALDVIGLHRLSLEVYDHNPRARRVYEKCGFMTEGRLRDALLWDGRRHDAIVMSILSTDPRPNRAPS